MPSSTLLGNYSSTDRLLGAVGAAAATVLGLLALKYNDRAIFDEKREGMVNLPGYPLVGGLPKMLANKERILDLILQGFEDNDCLTS